MSKLFGLSQLKTCKFRRIRSSRKWISLFGCSLFWPIKWNCFIFGAATLKIFLTSVPAVQTEIKEMVYLFLSFKSGSMCGRQQESWRVVHFITQHLWWNAPKQLKWAMSLMGSKAWKHHTHSNCETTQTILVTQNSSDHMLVNWPQLLLPILLVVEELSYEKLT